MRVIGFALFMLLSPWAGAMSWAELRHEIESVESGNPTNVAIVQRLAEAVEAMAFYNGSLRRAGIEDRLFCPPENGSLQLDEVVSMIRAQSRRDSSPDTESVQKLLLNAFIFRYPCNWVGEMP